VIQGYNLSAPPPSAKTRGGLSNAPQNPKAGFDGRSAKPKQAGNELYAKAILHEPRRGKKANF
jgi:hypothetical protein